MDETRKRALLSELRRLEAKAQLGPADIQRAGAIASEVAGLAASQLAGETATGQLLDAAVMQLNDRKNLNDHLKEISGPMPDGEQRPGYYPYAGRTDLASALEQAGFDPKTKSRVTVAPFTYLETKTGSVGSPTEVEDTARRIFPAASLGADPRYIFPRINTVPVEPDATGVQTYRQKSRTLPMDPIAGVRAIDDTQTKEEVDTESEVFTADLKMIAHIQSQTPNILLQNDNFRMWVNSDLVGAYRVALDAHIVDEITSASIPNGGGGTNVFEEVLYSMETVTAAGYAPNLVVVSPADALAIRLLIMADGATYAFTQTLGQLPAFVVSTAVADGEGFVMDTSALGSLFIGPFSFAVFEENSGSTNSSTVRAESSGAFVVQRADAAATLAGSS